MKFHPRTPGSRRGRQILLCALALLASSGALRADGVAIRLEKGNRGSVFRVAGWEGTRSVQLEAAREIFAVYVADRSDAPPLLGSYRIEDGALIFEPRFPLEPGLRYRAVFKPTSTVANFELPNPEVVPSTVVEHVYPSTNRLPENQLKFYVHFSAPMSRREAYRRVRLLDETGRQIQLPFLELDEELWDREGKRLTIFFDPGRIKRGLLPREEVGSPIEEGKSYTLIIDREWRDAQSKALKQAFQKSFRVDPADRQPPDPKQWRLSQLNGVTAPLTLEFPEPMDRALLERLLDVTDARGKSVPGSIEVDRDETRWRFTPREPWKAGDYSLLVGTTLEDLAGNHIGRLFEVDVFERVDDGANEETVSLPFRVPPARR